MIQHKIQMITEGIQRHGQDQWWEFDLGKRHSFQLLGLLHHFKTSAYESKVEDLLSVCLPLTSPEDYDYDYDYDYDNYDYDDDQPRGL